MAKIVNIDHLTFPRGACVTRITPQRIGGEKPQREIEVRAYDSPSAPLLDIDVTPAQLKELQAAGRVKFDSDSGRDSKLHFYYKHYLAV